MSSGETGSLHQNGSEVWSEDEHEVQNLERLKVLELATMCTVPMALRAAIILDVFEIMNKVSPTHHISAHHIAAHIPATTTAYSAATNLDRILKLLASQQILTAIFVEVDGKYETRYGLTPLCKHLINNNNEKMGSSCMSVAPLVVLFQDQVVAACQYLSEAVMDGGEAFSKAHGKNLFQLTADADSRFGQLFNSGMGSHSILIMKAVLEVYNGFKDIRKLVDVGGGLGHCLNMIVCKYPLIQGINFDLPDVIAHAPPYPGIEHVGGNMFESVPPAEAFFMKWILHDWNDDKCVKILKNCYRSLPRNGKVIVLDALLLSAVDSSFLVKFEKEQIKS